MAEGEDNMASIFSVGFSLRGFLARKPVVDCAFDRAVFTQAKKDASAIALNEIVARFALSVCFADVERGNQVRHPVSADSCEESR